MAKARELTALSDRELETAYERAWKRYYKAVREQNRRRMIERYGSENPELDEYLVELSLECTFSMTVKARSIDEAEQIARDDCYINTENYDQIDFWDSPSWVADAELEVEAVAAE
jgi:hypothetical protein